jgi:hypothetical protein
VTDLELLRQNVSDAVEPYTWADPVLQGLLDRCGGDVNLAACQVWLWRAGANALRNFKYKTPEGTSIDKTMTASECREQAALYRSMATSEPADATVEVEWTNAFDSVEGVS